MWSTVRAMSASRFGFLYELQATRAPNSTLSVTSARSQLFYFRSLVSSTVVATVIRPLLAKEALEEFYRARYDSVRQFLAKLLARLAGVT